MFSFRSLEAVSVQQGCIRTSRVLEIRHGSGKSDVCQEDRGHLVGGGGDNAGRTQVAAEHPGLMAGAGTETYRMSTGVSC